MKNFSLVHRNIFLNIVCDNEFESVLKQHFRGNTKITSEIFKTPTYTLWITSHINTIDGVYHKMVDKWFNYSTLDCWIDNDKNICYISNFHADCIRNRNLTIQYFASNLFNRLLELKGYFGIHSSCVEKNNQGIIFIGERLAGKTTCMLTLLNNDFNLVNNDTAAIKYIENERQVEAFGITKNIFIRMSKSFSTQPNNLKYLQIAKKQNICYTDDVKLEENRIIITPSELAELNNVKLLPSILINAIIIPKYNASLNELKLTLVDKQFCTQLLNSQILPLVHDTTSFLSDIHIFNYEDCSTASCFSHLLSLPSYLCEYNEKTLHNLSNEIQNILKEQKGD